MRSMSMAGRCSPPICATPLRASPRRKARARKLVDLGCMQINHRYHGEKFPSVEAMFDPARNVDYAARFLKDLREREGKLDDGCRALQRRSD